MPQRHVFICHLFLEFSHFIFMKDSDLSEKKTQFYLKQSVYSDFAPCVIHILVSSEVSCPPQWAGMSNTVHSITLRVLLGWDLSSLLSYSVSKMLNTTVCLFFVFCICRRGVSAACFLVSGYWISEIKMGRGCSRTILLSTEMPTEKAPTLCWYHCVCGLAESTRDGHGSCGNGTSSLKWHNSQI